MDVHLWLPIAAFVALVLFSAFFSGSESALFSLTEIDLRKLKDKKEKSPSVKRILFILKNPARLLNVILIGNTVINVAAATIAALFSHNQWPDFMSHRGVWAQIIIVTFVLLIFSEVTPKILAIRNPLSFSQRVSLPLVLIVRILGPIAFVFEKFTALIRIRKNVPFINEEELKTLFDVGEENGHLDENEREMIHSIFEFGDTQVREIMVPRTDMVRVEKNTTLDEVLDIVREKGHSRIPVFDDKVDNITGILHVKDLLPYMNSRNIPPISELARKAYFIPESKMIDDLLREFQQERIHMAIVVDEYGGTAGLITLEDIIEEIVGDIHDEYDKEKPLIQKVEESVWLVDSKISIEELNDEIDISLPIDEEYESLGGFILRLTGRIPDARESFEYEGVQLVIEKVDSNRIQMVRLKKSPHTENSSTQNG